MSDYPAEQLKGLMNRQGGVIFFGPQYLEATMALLDRVKKKAVFSAAKMNELVIPDTIMIDCSLVFCHSLPHCAGRGVTSAELKAWEHQLLEGIIIKAAAVPGLTPEDLEEPAKHFYTLHENTNDVVLLVQWGWVPSTYCVEVALALERAYARITA